ncbi:MAG: PEPxxWA-CTERM sorting domain-containing protein [Caulobacterales bacterium]|jgi:hypothetical protein
MTRSVLIGALASATVALASAAQAQTITNLSSQGWTSPASEDTGGGSAAITTTAPRSGNGSLELGGDRVRVELNDMYAAPSASNNLGTLSQWTDLGMEYKIALDSTTSISPFAGPALRIDTWSGGVKTEFVWEQAYQNTGYSNVAAIGDWNTVAAGGNFYIAHGSELDNMSLADWVSGGRASGDAIVTSINVGLGSGISGGGTHPHEFVDNISGDGHDFNFEVATAGGVPEPASWTLMIVGFAGIGGGLRRSRKGAAAATA